MRVIAKSKPEGGKPFWGVYDTKVGSWPIQIPGFGRVKERLTQAEAEAEAARLDEFFRDATVASDT